jgi:hypothetical protein
VEGVLVGLAADSVVVGVEAHRVVTGNREVGTIHLGTVIVIAIVRHTDIGVLRQTSGLSTTVMTGGRRDWLL